jgi:putative heme-binding domain-containing protein
VADFYNRIIGHYEVDLRHPLRDRERGRIWRIVYRGKEGDAPPPRVPPDLTALPVSDLLKFLDNPNLTLRALATNELVERAAGDQKSDVVRALSKMLRGAKENTAAPTALQRAHLLWASQRCGSLRRGEIDLLADDPSALVRVHLVKALGEHHEWNDIEDLVRSKLADKDAFVRRAAVESLGRHPSFENIEPLLKLWETTLAEDTHLVHTARIALRDHLLVKGAYDKLKPLLEKQPQYVHRVARVSLGARTAESGRFVLDYLTAHRHDGGALDAYLHHAARYVPKTNLAAVFDHAKSYQSGPLEQQRVAVKSLHRALQERGASLPEDLQNWAKAVAQQLLKSRDEAQLRGGVEIAKDMRIRGVFTEVSACLSPTYTPELRSLACEALAAIDAAAAVEPLASLVGDGAESLDVRRKAAAVLAGPNEPRAREALLKHLPSAPGALAVEMAHGLSRSPEGGQALVAAVEKGKATARLLQDRTVLNNLQQSQPADLLKRVAGLTAGLSPVEERIAQLIEERRNAFAASNVKPEDGRAVFKKICAACHKINGEGNKIGPELDGIGLRGLDRLIEDILDPSRTVDEAFRATQVLTKDGRTVQGLKLRTDGEVLVLADNEGKEQRVPSDQIERQSLTKLSPMPANVGEALPADDLSRLLKFLLAQRQAVKLPSEKSPK